MVAISASTYSPLFYRGTESNITSFSIQKAAVILATDTHKVFLDSEQTTRVEISDFIKGYTENQIKAKSAGAIYLNKIYRASDTNHLFVYQYDEDLETNVVVDITDFKVSEAVHADSATTANMYHADVADHASTADYATSAGNSATAEGPADESDWDFGVPGEFGNLTALVES